MFPFLFQPLVSCNVKDKSHHSYEYSHDVARVRLQYAVFVCKFLCQLVALEQCGGDHKCMQREEGGKGCGAMGTA